MKRWTVRRPGCSEHHITADRMTITDGGTLIFWLFIEGQYADEILLAIADSNWLDVELTQEKTP